MRHIILTAMVAVLTVSGVAMAAPGDDQNSKGAFVVLGFGAGATYYTTLDDNLFDLGLIPSVYSKFGLGYKFNEKNQFSVYMTPTYALLDGAGFFTSQGYVLADKPKSNESFTTAGGVMSGGGLSADYVFKPSPSYGFGPYVSGKRYTALTCDNFYKENSKNMTCDYSKASSFETGLSANYYFSNGFNPFITLGYTQLNFDSHPYQGANVVVGLNYIFTPARDSKTAALILF